MPSRALKPLVVVALLVVVAACGGSQAPAVTTVPTTVTTTPATTSTTAPTTTTTEPRGPVTTDDISSMVAAAREAAGVPAMGAAIISKDGIHAIGVDGLRRVGSDTAVTLADRWHLGSMLKAITGMLAAIAVDEGKISWDTTLGEAYPDLTVSDAWTDVTLADLLNMGSGMAGWVDGITGTTARQQRDSAVEKALTSTPAATAGTYYYSNLAYVVAGSMIERAYGTDYEDLIVEKIANPLGATGIGWGPQNTAGQADQPVPHTLDGNTWTPRDNWDNPPGLSAAGRAHMPLESWAKIMQELLKANAGESTLISTESAAVLFEGVTPAGGPRYAVGWLMGARGWDRFVAFHNGTNLANFATAELGLEGNVGFLIVMNAGYADGSDGRKTTNLLRDMVAWWQENG